MSELNDALQYIAQTKRLAPALDKDGIKAAYIKQFRPVKRRSVYVGNGYSLRFSQATGAGFSNTVLSLSALALHDAEPFVVVLVRQAEVAFLLANATMLRKISHSSLQFRTDNIKGSFNGTDILTQLNGLANTPANFEELFALHIAFGWQENVERLVESTNAIVGRDSRFRPTKDQLEILMDAPARAAAALHSDAYRALSDELCERVAAQRRAISAAALIDNVNVRGNAIEQIITGGENRHDLGDLIREIDGGRMVIDIKTKLVDRASAPKAYNVDKMLALLSEPASNFALLLVAVDPAGERVKARLLPILEQSILNATGIQHHWAGRSSRGATQLSGDFARGLTDGYVSEVDIPRAHAFLDRLIAL